MPGGSPIGAGAGPGELAPPSFHHDGAGGSSYSGAGPVGVFGGDEQHAAAAARPTIERSFGKKRGLVKELTSPG